MLTPFTAGGAIDAEALGGFIDKCYLDAGTTPDAIDSGAVILTGEAIKKSNAEAIDELFAEQAGKFVCATAGHQLEAMLDRARFRRRPLLARSATPACCTSTSAAARRSSR